MVKRIISRKNFLSAAIGGLAGFKVLSQTFEKRLMIFPEKRKLGKTGILVSPLCFGAPRTNEESLIRYAIDNGIDFIDTGQSYGNGNNEKLVGKAVSGKRKDVIIQSKIRLEMNELPAGGKGKKGADEIRSLLNYKLEASLKSLDTDYIDVFLYHDAVDETLLFHTEVMKFFTEIKSSGVIKAHGFSAHNEVLNLHERNNKELFYDVIMAPFNHKGSFVHSVSGRFSEWDQHRLIVALEEAGRKGVGIIAMKTCSGGKYSPSSGIEPCYMEAVKWVLGHSFISSAAIAMANFEQINEHVG
jgi:hypothetical protein